MKQMSLIFTLLLISAVGLTESLDGMATQDYYDLVKSKLTPQKEASFNDLMFHVTSDQPQFTDADRVRLKTILDGLSESDAKELLDGTRTYYLGNITQRQLLWQDALEAFKSSKAKKSEKLIELEKTYKPKPPTGSQDWAAYDQDFLEGVSENRPQKSNRKALGQKDIEAKISGSSRAAANLDLITKAK